MKRIAIAFVLSYLATMAIAAAFAWWNRSLGQVVGNVAVWQELEVPDYRAGEFGNFAGREIDPAI